MSEVSNLIYKEASNFQLAPQLIAAVIHQESNGNPFAVRYEEKFFNKYLRNKAPKELQGSVPDFNVCSIYTERILRASSLGLMQVLGETAREMGFAKDFLTELCIPRYGIEYGCKYLFRMLEKHGGEVTAALLSYNGGGNPLYPKEVLGHIEDGAMHYLLI